MQNACSDSKKRKKNFNAISNKNKKSEKSQVSNDEEFYYKLIDSEHTNALINSLIFNDLKHKNALLAIKELQNYYSTLKSTTNKLHQIVIANENKYNIGEIGNKRFESKRLINILNMVNSRVNDDSDSLEKINNNLVEEYNILNNTNKPIQMTK